MLNPTGPLNTGTTGAAIVIPMSAKDIAIANNIIFFMSYPPFQIWFRFQSLPSNTSLLTRKSNAKKSQLS
jgi:hypothetical protein